MPEAHHSASDLANRVVSIDRAIAGAWVLIVAMVVLTGFAWWLVARYGHRSAWVGVGGGELGLAATIHLVENLLVMGLYDGIIRPMGSAGSTSPAGDALWAAASSASVLAFGVLGLGALTAGIGSARLGCAGMVRLLGRHHRLARIRRGFVRSLHCSALRGRTIQPQPARVGSSRSASGPCAINDRQSRDRPLRRPGRRTRRSARRARAMIASTTSD